MAAPVTEQTVGRFDTQAGVRLGVVGEPFFRVHITPQGEIRTGSGALPPVGEVFARRIADGPVVNNSITVVPDGVLEFPVVAGEFWTYTAKCVVRSSATADFRVSITAPAGAAGYSTLLERNEGLVDAMPLGAATVVSTLTTSILTVEGFVDNAAGAAGVVAVNYAQSTATAIDTFLLPGSYIAARRRA